MRSTHGAAGRRSTTFWGEPNIYISQHVAGMNSAEHFWPLVGALMEENVRRFAADEPLINVVDVRRGY